MIRVLWGEKNTSFKNQKNVTARHIGEKKFQGTTSPNCICETADSRYLQTIIHKNIPQIFFSYLTIVGAQPSWCYLVCVTPRWRLFVHCSCFSHQIRPLLWDTASVAEHHHDRHHAGHAQPVHQRPCERWTQHQAALLPRSETSLVQGCSFEFRPARWTRSNAISGHILSRGSSVPHSCSVPESTCTHLKQKAMQKNVLRAKPRYYLLWRLLFT